MITIVNCLKTPCTHYCGRPGSFKRAKGSPKNLSILGNPYEMHCEMQRASVCQRYEKYLWKRMQVDNTIVQVLLSIPPDAVLGCFCSPRSPCHCETIKAAAEWLRNSPEAKTLIEPKIPTKQDNGTKKE